MVDEFRAVGTANQPGGPRGAVDFFLLGLGYGEDEYAQDPQQRAEEEPSAGLTAFPESPRQCE